MRSPKWGVSRDASRRLFQRKNLCDIIKPNTFAETIVNASLAQGCQEALAIFENVPAVTNFESTEQSEILRFNRSMFFLEIFDETAGNCFVPRNCHLDDQDVMVVKEGQTATCQGLRGCVQDLLGNIRWYIF